LQGASRPRRIVRVIHARESIVEHEPACQIVSMIAPAPDVTLTYGQLVESLSAWEAGSAATGSAGIGSEGRV
jgi:hypothetical protein